MTERIFKNWKTTLLGIIMLVGSLLLVYYGKATLTEASAFMVAGFSMFFLKDPKNNGLSIVLLALIFYSCQKPVVNTTVHEREKITYRDTIITLESKTVERITDAENDSIKYLLNELKLQGKKPVIVYKNNKENISLTYKLDELGRLVTSCNTDKELIRLQNLEIQRLKNEKQIVTKYKTPSWIRNTLFICIVLILILISVIGFLVKRKFLI